MFPKSLLAEQKSPQPMQIQKDAPTRRSRGSLANDAITWPVPRPMLAIAMKGFLPKRSEREQAPFTRRNVTAWSCWVCGMGCKRA